MTTRLIHVLLAGTLTLLSTTGCSAMDDQDKNSKRVFDRQQSQQEASAVLASWFPPGTPMDEAVSAMEANGFTCSPAQTHAGSIRGVSCDISLPEPTGTQAARLALSGWTVMLGEGEGQSVSRIFVGRFPEDLGSKP